MSAQDNTNSSIAIKQVQYSNFILKALPDFDLPSGFYRDITDMEGETLEIPVVGTVEMQDVSDDVPLTFNAIDSGRIQMYITEQEGDAWAVKDKLKQDGFLVDQLMAARATESVMGLARVKETKFLSAAAFAQVVSDPNIINEARHRIVGSGTDYTIELEDFAYLSYAFDVANVRAGGRVAIVHPSMVMKLNRLVGANAFKTMPEFSNLMTEGFAQDHRFVANIFGWDIYVSNMLPRLTVAETASTFEGTVGAATAAVGFVANVFMSVADDQHKPMMHALRLAPTVEAWRDSTERADKYQTITRYGFGCQRTDTLAVVLTDPTKFTV
jgi:hypothetical protein